MTDDFREGRIFEHRFFVLAGKGFILYWLARASFCIGGQGLLFVFLNIYVFPEEQWQFVTDCTTKTGIVIELYLLCLK
jgi:hypothetical protein